MSKPPKALGLLCVALFAAVCAADELPTGTQVSFRGSVAPLDRDQAAQKTFDLLLVVSEGNPGRRLHWTIEERGRGAWPWTQRFGRLNVDERWQTGDQAGPALLYDLAHFPLPIQCCKTGGGRGRG